MTRGQVPKQTGGDKVEVTILDPTGEERAAQVTDCGNGTYTVNFTGEPGEYTIGALINGAPAKDCPFVFKIPEFSKKFAVTEKFSKLKSKLGL